MPKRDDIHKILIIGSGPIIISQACEFDYSGTQACKALKEEGYEVVLVNSNPATIMTDPKVADSTYIEPITPEVVAKIIEKEKPDALLPTLGGQTGLNTAMKLYEAGVLEKHNVKMLAANYDVIKKAIKDMPERVAYLINLLLISRHLERIADHATNIAEEVVYMIEGEIVRHGRLTTEPE